MITLAYLAVFLFGVALTIFACWACKNDQGTLTRSAGPRFFFVFIFGLTCGFAFAILALYPYDGANLLAIYSGTRAASSEDHLLHHNMEMNSSFADELLRGVKEVSARRLAKEVRVLCWIMTTPENHREKAFAVKATWGRHCNTLLFMSDGDDDELPSINLKSLPGREGLWSKTVEAFKHVYQHYQEDYDWVLKADDDTYVVIENLRAMLLPYPPSNPWYFGFHFKPHTPQGYMSGGAGYVLSKEAIRRVVTQAFDGKHKDCHDSANTEAEDINISKCLQAVGVSPGDSRDSQGRGRFFPFDVEDHVNPIQEPKDWWYWDYIYWPMQGGLSCCSDQVVSFHYLNPPRMYMLEYLIYHVSPFGVMHLERATPPPHVITTPTPFP